MSDRSIMSGHMDTDADLCHCGSCLEALKKAEELFIQLAAADCPIWALQIGSALRHIAIRNLTEVEPTQPLHMIQEACNQLVAFNRHHMRSPVEVQAAYRAKREDLFR